MKNVVIIRDKGQITIPDTIRKTVPWATPFSTVSLTVTKSDEIVIKPHKTNFDKDEILSLVKRSRANKGHGKGSAASFLVKDRASH